MPFVRISVPAGEGDLFNKTAGQAIHEAMVQTINVPEDDRFQVFTEHNSNELLFDRNYLNIPRSDRCIFIQITMKDGRTPAQKKALYAAIAGNLQNRVGWRKQDVMIVLSENDVIDWSFGNGEAQGAGIQQ